MAWCDQDVRKRALILPEPWIKLRSELQNPLAISVDNLWHTGLDLCCVRIHWIVGRYLTSGRPQDRRGHSPTADVQLNSIRPTRPHGCAQRKDALTTCADDCQRNCSEMSARNHVEAASRPATCKRSCAYGPDSASSDLRRPRSSRPRRMSRPKER